MTAKIHALGAHISRSGLLSEIDQVCDGALELRREHVICVVAKALVAQRNIWRIIKRPSGQLIYRGDRLL